VSDFAQLVVLSLKLWDEFWRRHQLMIAALLACRPDLHVIFVEPPVPTGRLLQRSRARIGNRSKLRCREHLPTPPSDTRPVSSGAPLPRGYGIRQRAADLG